jgi:hypothetical protein
LSVAREDGPCRARDRGCGCDRQTPGCESSPLDSPAPDALGDGVLGEINGVATFGGRGAEQVS